MSNEMQSRHNDYNYQNQPAIKGRLEKYPLKQIIFNWNRLDIDLKATGDIEEFQRMLNSKILDNYRHETECPDSCFIVTICLRIIRMALFYINFTFTIILQVQPTTASLYSIS